MLLRGTCALLFLLLLLGGCGLPAERTPSSIAEPAAGESAAPTATEPATEAAAAPSPTEDGFVYAMSLDAYSNHIWYVDGNGDDVTGDAGFKVLYDEETGKAQCQYLERIEDTGEDEEWGAAIARRFRALYDMEGNLLRDWEEITYNAGYGDLIIRQENIWYSGGDGGPPEDPATFETELYNFRTDEVVMDKVDDLQPFGDGNFLARDHFMSPLGIVDKDGKLIQEPPEEKYFYAWAFNEHIVAGTVNMMSPDYDGGQEQESVLLDRDYNVLATQENISTDDSVIRTDDALTYTNYDGDDRSSGFMNLNGEVIFEIPANESIDYYDGELFVFNHENSGAWGDFSLEAMDGTVLAEGFSYLTPDLQWDDKGIADRFLGIKDNRAVLLGRDGTELLSFDLPPNVIGIYPMDGGFYDFSAELREETPPYDAYSTQGGLLGSELQEIVPAEERQSFSWLSYYAGGDKREWDEALDKKDDRILRMRETRDYRLQNYAVLRQDGSVVVDGINRIHDVGPNRIAVTKGFSIGLMDWDGNWIVRRSLFSDFRED